jgi:hypothetical protein
MPSVQGRLVRIISFYDLDIGRRADGSKVMHSGIGAVNAVRVARSKGLQTVETTMALAVKADPVLYKDTLGKFCITKEQFCTKPEHESTDWIEAWAQISKAWADYAEEQTTLATHSAGPDKDSFYKRVEEPILQGKGVRIITDDQYKKVAG